MVLKFCANLSFMFTQETDNLLERYQLASQAGFKAVECAFPYPYSIDDVVKVRCLKSVFTIPASNVYKDYLIFQGQNEC